MRFGALCREVERHLSQAHRYAHVVRVARLADRFAQAHGEDAGKARLAGMLHDLARLYSDERLLAECAARGMEIEPFERAHPVVLHARLGAELARERFGVGDEEVLSAIRKHTLGAPRMSRLDAIVYLADGLEPGRAYPERVTIEALAFADLDAAMYDMLAATMRLLHARNQAAAPQTLAALHHYRTSLPQRSSLSA